MRPELLWEQRVGGSNPSAPTIDEQVLRLAALAQDFACVLGRRAKHLKSESRRAGQNELRARMNYSYLRRN